MRDFMTMQNGLDLEIHNQLVRYLAGEISLRDFRAWFDASTWHMEERGANRDALDLAGVIEFRLAEFSNAHWTEEELRSRLLPLVRVYAQNELSWGTSNCWYRASSSTVTVSQTVALGSPVDIQASVVFV